LRIETPTRRSNPRAEEEIASRRSSFDCGTEVHRPPLRTAARNDGMCESYQMPLLSMNVISSDGDNARNAALASVNWSMRRNSIR